MYSNEKIKIVKKIPQNWEDDHNQYKSLSLKNKKAVTKYRRNVDSIYENIQIIKLIIADRNKLNNVNNKIINLKELIFKESKDDGINRIKTIEKNLNEIAGAELIKEKLSKARRILKKEDVEKTFNNIKSKWKNLDFVVHAIAFSDRSELSGEYINTSRENFLKSMLISCFSFTEIAKEASKIMNKGSSILTLTYESSKVIPNYNVMGVCKAALESSVKYLARDLGSKGIRVNAISAGPIKTLAASAIGDAKFLYKWNEDHSLLKRNVDANDVGGSALYLLSNLASAVTGEIHYVDGGYNKVGMPNPKNIT